MSTADKEPLTEIERSVAGTETVPLTWKALVSFRIYQLPDAPDGLIRNLMIWPADTFCRDEIFVRTSSKELPVPEVLVVGKDPALA